MVKVVKISVNEQEKGVYAGIESPGLSYEEMKAVMLCVFKMTGFEFEDLLQFVALVAGDMVTREVVELGSDFDMELNSSGGSLS